MNLLTLILVGCSIVSAQTMTGRTSIGGSVTFGSTVAPSISAVPLSTQLAISYTAPNSSPCTVEASESPTYLPLVPDVDTALFGVGSNSDTRDGALANGTARVFVLGQRTVQLASDANNYSRALQAYTTHYIRVTCGATVLTGTGTTMSIPEQMTYEDLPPALMPTLSTTDRTQVVIDPRTGAQIRRVSLPADYGYPSNASHTGPYIYDGGFRRGCGENLVGPGPGYLCSFAQGGGGPGVVYYLIPSTGEARFLGYFPGGIPYPYINPADSKWYYMSGADLVVTSYTGTYVAAAASTTMSPVSTTTILASVPTAIHAYDSTFTAANYNCYPNSVPQGDQMIIWCGRGPNNQNHYGWLAAVQISTASISAATLVNNNLQCRWCSIHQILPVADQPVIAITTHGFDGNGATLGAGPYLSTNVGAVSVGATTITVSGEPACAGCGADPDLPLAQVGDTFRFSDNAENVTITAKLSPTSWQITATVNTHANGATLEAQCNFTPLYWKFLADPHGTDTTNTNFVADQYWPGGGHDDFATGVMVAQNTGWTLRLGSLLSQVNQPLTRTVSANPLFAGVLAQCYGDGCKGHPSMTEGQNTYLTDFNAWDGSYYSNFDDTLTNVSGQVYRYTKGTFPLNPKQFPMAGSTGIPNSGGPHVFTDVSPAVLSTGAGDSYKFCRAVAANECFSGSTPGQVYVNIPGTPSAGCTPNGPCIANFNPLVGAVQVDLSGTASRVITGGLAQLRDTNDYPTAHVTAGGEYMLFAHGDPDYHTPSDILAAKMPPVPVSDGVDRTTFVPAQISITTPIGMGISTATIEFGYQEFGSTAQRYCTSRAEACVAVSSSVVEATPFYYKTAESASYTKAPCSASCTITIPVLPLHAAYYQVKFYDAGGSLVTTGATGVAMESTTLHP